VSWSEGPPPAAAVPDPTAAATPPPDAVPATIPPAETVAPADAGSVVAPAPGRNPERIAERVSVLDGVGELPLPEHVELYQRLHAELQAALAEIDGP
jgi:hypothetical protein